MSEDNLVVMDKMRPVAPVVDIPIFHKLKRKFSDTVEAVAPFPPSPNKKSRAETESTRRDSTREDVKQAPLSRSDSGDAVATGTMHMAGTQSIGPTKVRPNVLPPTLSTDVDMSDDSAQAVPSTLTPLQQTIETQFNMQILMKHNELRLIEQELAKCQIALEQLRRCELRPYPGNDRPEFSVSEGTGAAVLPGPGLTRPSHPAPYGVTDGPYSRHYQQWLLRDELFDPAPIGSQLHSMDTPSSAAARSARGLPARKPISKTTSMSTRHTEAQQSLPNYPAAPVRDKSAPLVLRRSTDNQLVKLICNNCHRGNFSSIQGFLNHCRIAHKVDYKSHDLAAIDCGQLLDENELANLAPQNQPAAPTPHHPKPVISRAPSTVATPARGNLVHPLNLTTTIPPVSKPSAKRAPAQPIKDLHSNRPQDPTDAPLKQSTQVPRLSQLFAKHNFGGDLEKAAAIARQRIDFNHHEDLPSPDYGSEQNSPLAFTAGPRPFSAITGNNITLSRPQSRKGHRQPTANARPRPTPLISADPHHHQQHYTPGPPSAAPSSATFSPNTVAESAPGLVSDHEDDDHDASASEEEGVTPQHHLHHHHHAHHHHGQGHHRPQRSCAENMEIDVEGGHAAVHEDGDVDVDVDVGVLIRRNSVFNGNVAKGGK